MSNNLYDSLSPALREMLDKVDLAESAKQMDVEQAKEKCRNYVEREKAKEDIEKFNNEFTKTTPRKAKVQGKLKFMLDNMDKDKLAKTREELANSSESCKDLEEASKEWLRPQLDESYANYGEAKMMELTHFDGYSMLEAIEFGVKWQKEQMMEHAIDADCFGHHGAALFAFSLPSDKYLIGSKVKVIVIKED